MPKNTNERAGLSDLQLQHVKTETLLRRSVGKTKAKNVCEKGLIKAKEKLRSLIQSFHFHEDQHVSCHLFSHRLPVQINLCSMMRQA